MTLDEVAKGAGIGGAKELTELAGFPYTTLRDMKAKHPIRFETVLYGCLVKKQLKEHESENNKTVLLVHVPNKKTGVD